MNKYKRGISLFDKINIRSYNIRKGVDNMKKISMIYLLKTMGLSWLVQVTLNVYTLNPIKI